MSNPVHMAFLVPLCICCYLLIHSPPGSPETMEPPVPDKPAGKFGGMYRRVLHDSPATLDPAFSTDIYGRAVINQIFEGLFQFDAHLKPIPAIANFWEASRDRRTWTFTLRQGGHVSSWEAGDGARFCLLIHPFPPCQRPNACD